MSNIDNDTSEPTPAQDELAALKSRADLMGIEYHPAIGLEKLRKKINDAIATDGPPKVTAPVVAKKAPAAPVAAVETDVQKRSRLRREANALVRIRVTCMNPAKKEHEGEIFTAGNSAVGTVSKYVPFNVDEGWHVPKIILNMIQDRQCQIFYTEKSKGGVSVRKGKLIKEFAVEILPPLTETELHELAQRQAMSKSVD